MKTFSALVLAAILAACASNGPRIGTAQLDELRKGQTTAAAIFKQFGRPNFSSKNIDGTQTAVYIHAEESGAGAAPVLGALSPSSETVTFYFDSAGVLSDYKYSPPATARAAAEPAAKSSPQVAPATAPSAGDAKAPPQAAPATATAAKPASDKSNVPYLWDILRNSTARDPRGQ